MCINYFMISEVTNLDTFDSGKNLCPMSGIPDL
jgi:hypothetical protein